MNLDEKWLESFYRECGREITLAYTTLNQMKNWAIVTAAACISGLAFGTTADKFPNVPMFIGTVIVFAFVLRFFMRAIICYVNLIRWNRLQNSCLSLNLLRVSSKGSPLDIKKQEAEDSLKKDIQNYYFLWLSPLNRKSQIIQNLKLGFMLLFTLSLFFLVWGFVALRNQPIVRGLGIWALGVAVLEFYDFGTARLFDDVSAYERKRARGETKGVFPVPDSSAWYFIKWIGLLILSLGIAFWHQPQALLQLSTMGGDGSTPGKWVQVSTDGSGIAYESRVFLEDIPLPDVQSPKGKVKFLDRRTAGPDELQLGYLLQVSVLGLDATKIPEKYRKPRKHGNLEIDPLTQVVYVVHFGFTLRDADGFDLVTSTSEPLYLSSGKENLFQGLVPQQFPRQLAAQTKNVIVQMVVERCESCY